MSGRYLETEAVEWESWDVNYPALGSSYKDMVFNVDSIAAVEKYMGDYTRIILNNGTSYIITWSYERTRAKLLNQDRR